MYLRATLTNTSDQDINYYPGMLVSTTNPAVTPDGDGAWLFAIFAGMSSPLEMAILTDPQFTPGESVAFEIAVDFLNIECPNADVELINLQIGN